jgi:hypothetical protein
MFACVLYEYEIGNKNHNPRAICTGVWNVNFIHVT